MTTEYQIRAPVPPPAPPAESKARRSKIWIPIAVIAAIVVAFGVFSSYSLVQAHSDINSLQHQVQKDNTALSSAQSSISQDSNTISGLNAQLGSLSGQLSNLTKPSDPLGSYNLICTSQNTNQFGYTQTYYYPCTNVAQTTPQPGT